MMDRIVRYIRSWFTEDDIREFRNPKRRALEHNIEYSSPKYRKVLSPMSNNFEGSFRREVRIPSFFKTAPKLSTHPISLLDDEDPIPGPSKPIQIARRSGFKTPLPDSKSKRLPNDDEDGPYFIRNIKSSAEKKADARKSGFSYTTRFTPNLNSVTSRVRQNGTSCKSTPIAKSANSSIGSSASFKSPTFDYSVNLDDKTRYEEMLAAAAEHGSFNNNISIYGTPLGRSFGSQSRGKMMLELVRSPRNKRTLEVVDLTDESKPRLSTKDTVIKVLGDFDGEIKLIEDSDSDIEILPTPPSPKPDIKVDRINTLKTVIDTSKATKPEWINAESKKYQNYIANKSKEIEAYSENSSTLGRINQDLLLKSLAHRVQQSLAIKDTVLPVVEDEDEEIDLPPLTDELLRLVKRAFSGDPDEILSKKFNLNISRRDLLTLAGLNWLNDNIINFYMNLLIERGNANAKWPKVYAMNTFFYQKLTTSGPESLKRWTRRVDIFAHEFICVPVHLGLHWCMAIINLKEKTIKYYDSMGKKNDACLYALKNYLEFEHMDKKQQPFCTNDFKLQNVRDIPQQMNGSDCGMFACTFAEFASRKSRFTFTQQEMPYLRKKMVIEVLTGQLLIQ